MSYFVTVDRPAGEARIHAGADRMAAFSGGQLGPFASADVAAQEAVNQGSGSIVFGDGTHLFSAAVTVDRECLIRLESGCTLTPNHTGSVGLFLFTGDRCGMTGNGNLVITTTVADQVVVEFSGCVGVNVDGPSVEFQNTTATSANPMTGFKFTGCVNVACQNTSVYPNEGTRGWWFYQGAGSEWSSNYWGTKTDGGLTTAGGVGEEWTPRTGWRGLQVEGTDYSTFGENCRFRGVGIVDDPSSDDDAVGDSVVDKMIYFLSTNTGGAGVAEEGHSRLSGFVVEGVHARNTVHISGQQFFQFTESQIGAGSGPKMFNGSSRLDCAVLVSAQGSKGCPDFLMQGVSIHNQQWGEQSVTSPPQVYLNGVERGDIRSNQFVLVQKGPAILVNHATNLYLSFKNNAFRSVEVASPPTDQATIPIAYFTGASRVEAGAYHEMGENVAWGFVNGFEDDDSLPLGFTGPVNPTGLDFDKSRPQLSASMTLSASAQTIVSTGNFTAADVQAGDLFDLRGSAQAGTGAGGGYKSSKGLMKVLTRDNNNQITVATNTYFTNFVAAETATMTIDWYPRTNTNISRQTVAY